MNSNSVQKLKHSALIALGGALPVAIGLLTKEVTDFLAMNDPIDWRASAIVLVTCISTWSVNTIKVWVQEQA